MLQLKYSILLNCLFLIIQYICTIYAHSWVACVNYQGSLDEYDEQKCAAFARGYVQFKSPSFGVDQGYNHRVQATDMICKTNFDQFGYNNNYKPLVANVNKLKILWPSKNHVAAQCTNAFIPDRQLKLYANCKYVKQNPTVQQYMQDAQLIWDFKVNGTAKGFQQCVQFCSNMDKAICYADVSLTKAINTDCLLVWFWEFNNNEFYTSCIDVFATSNTPIISTSRPSRLPTTKKPCVLNNYLKTCEKNLNLFKNKNC